MLVVNCLFGALFVVFITVLFFLINPVLSAQKIMKNEIAKCETSWELSDNEVLIRNKYSQTRFDWDSFDTVLDTKDHFLFIFTTNQPLIHILPKQAFESPDQLNEIKRMLKKHFGKD
jgi:hypothetical protein